MPGRKSGGYLPQQSYTAAPTLGLPVARPKKKLKALHWEKVDTPQVTIWATHAPTHQDKEEKYVDLARRGVLEEVEKLFLAKEIKQIGKSGGKKSDKKQIISSDLMRNFRTFDSGPYLKSGMLTTLQRSRWPNSPLTPLSEYCR